MKVVNRTESAKRAWETRRKAYNIKKLETPVKLQEKDYHKIVINSPVNLFIHKELGTIYITPQNIEIL